jgi:formylglycine-generating enzyme required for sulfatase activity
VASQPAFVCAKANIADAASQFTWRNTFCEDGATSVTAVAQFEAGAFELYDLRGNLWEWVSDCWRTTHDAPEPTGECETGTVRGASFDDPMDNLHPTVRQPVPIKRRQTNIGFRLARDAS